VQVTVGIRVAGGGAGSSAERGKRARPWRGRGRSERRSCSGAKTSGDPGRRGGAGGVVSRREVTDVRTCIRRMSSSETMSGTSDLPGSARTPPPLERGVDLLPGGPADVRMARHGSSPHQRSCGSCATPSSRAPSRRVGWAWDDTVGSACPRGPYGRRHRGGLSCKGHPRQGCAYKPRTPPAGSDRIDWWWLSGLRGQPLDR